MRPSWRRGWWAAYREPEVTDEMISEVADRLEAALLSGTSAQQKAILRQVVYELETDGKRAWPKYRIPGQGVFGGPAFEWLTEAEERDAEALEALRRFIDEYGLWPNQNSWTAAGMSPSERTIRNRFGSFRRAIDAANASG